MSRKSEALKRIVLARGKGLELGPLTSPLVTKNEADIYYVDHLSTEELQKHYEGHVLPHDIVPIDIVLVDNNLGKTLKGRKFDYVVASHVIEHIPDIVTWLADVASVLKEGGILSLVIPDKRFTFDIARNESRPADVVGAYLDKRTKPSSAVVFDNFRDVRKNIVPYEILTQPLRDFTKKPRQYTLEQTYALCHDNLNPDEYVDTHCFVFTPYSFFESVRTMIELDLFDYEIVYFKDTPKNHLEFYVSLKLSKKSSKTRKLKSLPAVKSSKTVPQLEIQVLKLQEKNNALNAELQNVVSSKSWQVTRPLRKITAMLHGKRIA